MTNQYMLAGSIVHSSIEWYLKLARMGHLTTLDDLHEAATNNGRRAWRQSLRGQWENNPKNACNLFEHYYDREIDTERMQATIMDCLYSFYTYALPTIIEHRDNWKTVEEFQNFSIGKCTVALKMDFAYEADGILHIIDWKSGKPSSSASQQLTVYALYAAQQWRLIPQDIIGVAHYLLHGAELSTFTIDSFNECIERIDLQVDMMAAYLVNCDLEQNEPLSPKMFPRTENEWKCNNCSYREVCHGR